MLLSFALIFLVGLAMADICQKLKVPRIIGMLVTGIILGPYVLNLLDCSILSISGDLRQIALVIILIKAGLSLNLEDLKKVGRPAILMSFLPATFELLAFVIFGPKILGITWIESAVMGAVLAAVSPAVVVPRMIDLMEKKYGSKKSIPQLIMAGASCDDIFVIVLFTTFVNMAQGGSINFMDFVNIPISIIMGIILGIIVGFALSFFFETKYIRQHYIRNSVKVMIILGVSFLLLSIENMLKGIISVSGLLAIVSMACIIKIRSSETVTNRLAQKFGKLWLAAEVILFVLVGAAVNIRYTISAGIGAVLMIFIALCFRSLGVLICVSGSAFKQKEKLFCIISYLPKATVQAAIGSVPLAMGLPCGKVVLSVAVLGILITAPIGAFGIDHSYKRLLEKE